MNTEDDILTKVLNVFLVFKIRLYNRKPNKEALFGIKDHRRNILSEEIIILLIFQSFQEFQDY